MAKFFITDEVNDSRTADVLPSGALEVASVYSTYFVNSGTASGTAVDGACILHAVNVTTTAAKGQLLLGNPTEASSMSNLTSASVIAKIDLAARGSYLLDAYVSGTLSYRLTGLDCDGITLSYQLV